MNNRIVFVVAPDCSSPLSKWYSPGRSAKLNQVLSLLKLIEAYPILINTCPAFKDLPFDSQIQISQSKAAIPRVISFLLVSRNCFRSLHPSIIWVYNSRVPEMLLVWRLKLLYPHTPLIVELEDLPAARKSNSSWRGTLDWLATRWLVRHSSFVTCVSKEVANSLTSRIPISPSRLKILSPLIDSRLLAAVQNRPLEPFSRKFIRVLYAGGYSPEKGVEDLLWAFRSLDPKLFRLHLVGPASQLIKEAAKGLTHVYLHGTVESHILYTLYTLADIVVNPHRSIHNGSHVFPFKTIEQVASGALPLQSTALGSTLSKLPKAFLFSNRNELYHALYNSRQIWSDNKHELGIISASLRYQYSLPSFVAKLSSWIQDL